MPNTLLINVDDHEIRVCLIEDGNPVELYIERDEEKGIAGNIYKGEVVRVLPGMQSAFVDIGVDRAAFLFVGDVRDEFAGLDTSAPNKSEHGTEEVADSREKSKIQNLLKIKQDILVQVMKNPMGSKGAKITSYLSIPGRHLVYMPTINYVGISKKIEDKNERERLKEVISRLKPKDVGVIARTVCQNKNDDVILEDLKYLDHVWQSIQKKAKKVEPKDLVYEEFDLALKSVRDLVTDETEKIIVDSKQQHEKICDFVNKFIPNLKDKIELYEDEVPLFEKYGIEKKTLRSAFDSKVWLKSGGYIFIEHTEALTTIDVNTGKYVGKGGIENTMLRTNLEATKEIAHQLRLRNIGGIIVIDFIDMDEKCNKELVFETLKEELKKDKAKTTLLPISEFGLLQMTRKRTRETLNKVLMEPCYYCAGSGIVKSKITTRNEIFREFKKQFQKRKEIVSLELNVHPDIALLIEEEKHPFKSKELAKIFKENVKVIPCPEFHITKFKFVRASEM